MVIFCFFFASVVNAVRGPPRAEKSDIKHVVKVGDSLKIKCPIHGYPPPIVSWEKDEDEISYAWSRYRATRKTLKIKKVGKEDMGTYVCTGINGFGKAETRIELVVINPEDFPSISETDINSLSEPVFSKDTIKTTKDITLDSGDSVSLLCSASSVPNPRSHGTRTMSCSETVVLEARSLSIRFPPRTVEFTPAWPRTWWGAPASSTG